VEKSLPSKPHFVTSHEDKLIFVQDIIQLLPDHLANQIAAGEVIQRPSSAVKELLEIAIDAGATEIQLILKDAGKELIQVVDNGNGMSPMDARMSFERHATSKIRGIDDLFAIRTMGFRGEALASVAAVAQVELKTRQHEEETGTHLMIEATEVKRQETTACSAGTSISIKNLFYNVPARRKFLKSNTSEYKHILDEFTRIAMARPEIAFRVYHNNTEQFHLKAEHLKSRIIALLGNKAEKNLVPVAEDTELLKINGYIGKPEAATRTRGNQFFFVNDRFIRSPYLNHAVVSAFEGLLEKDLFPFYVLFLELDPQRVDVNVHPSKQEVKFDDERMLYAYIHAAATHALARFNIAPSLDFSLNPEIQNLSAISMPVSDTQKDNVRNGLLHHSFSEKGRAHLIDHQQERQNWQQQRSAFFPDLPAPANDIRATGKNPLTATETFPFSGSNTLQQNALLQWGEYLITTVKSGFLLLHQKRALERILYENLTERVRNGHPVSQRLLFPVAIETSAPDAVLLQQALPFLRKTGYDIEPLGQQSFAINGAPADISAGRAQEVLEDIMEQVKHEPSMLKDKEQDRLLKIMARQMARPKSLSAPEAQALIDELFACAQPQYAPGGKAIFQILSKEQLAGLL
jgi:DNA mismatch repair protein MutL